MKTNATQFLSADQALNELDALKFSYRSIVELLPLGSFERETAQNAAKGIAARIDYLHDSFGVLLGGRR